MKEQKGREREGKGKGKEKEAKEYDINIPLAPCGSCFEPVLPVFLPVNCSCSLSCEIPIAGVGSELKGQQHRTEYEEE